MDRQPSHPPLILASESSARKALLQRLGLPFRCEPAAIDEAPQEGEAAHALAERLALEKARAVARKFPGHCVIGADQVAAHRGVPFGKPMHEDRARRHLRRFSGEEVEFLTAVCVREPDGAETRFMDRTRVGFRALTDDDIQRYVRRDQPLECAGSFRAESLGPALFDYVESRDPTGLLGLPLIGLCGALRDAGFALP